VNTPAITLHWNRKAGRMKIRWITWALLPAESVVIFFVLLYYPRLSALQPNPNKPKWEQIQIGMNSRQVEKIMGREPGED